MGQQQLILLVLATVIVGLAIVVGIQAFSENSNRANADAMMQDGVRIANDIQAAIKKPAPFGGVDGFNEIDFGILGYPVVGEDEDAVYVNLNGSFSLTPGANGVTIEGTSIDELNSVEVRVCGLSDRTIKARVVSIGGQDTGAAALDCNPEDDTE